MAGADGTANASYGDAGGFTRVSPFASWIAQVMAQPLLPGDANRDGKVTFADYLVLESNFGKTGMVWTDADFNGDGTVTFADYLQLEANFGKSAPEPTTLFYALAGLATIMRRRGCM
jgi:hypothetical protein